MKGESRLNAASLEWNPVLMGYSDWVGMGNRIKLINAKPVLVRIELL